MHEADAVAPPPRSALLIIFLVVVIDLLGFAIVLPLLPRIAENYLAGRSKLVTGIAQGLLFSSFSAMQFIFAPLWGRLSDRIGRRPVMLVGLAGSVVFYSLFGFAATIDSSRSQLALTLLFVARIGAGIAGATISTAAAAIADVTPPDQRKRGMALIGAAFGVGFTFGPLVAFGAIKLLPEHGEGSVGYVAAGLSFVALLLGVWLLKETKTANRPAERRGWLNFDVLSATLKIPTVGMLVVAYFLVSFSMANFEATLSLLTKSALNYGNDDNFLIFAYVGFILVLVQGGIYRPIAKHVSEAAFIRFGVLLMMLGLAGGLCVLLLTGGNSSLSPSLMLTLFLIVLAVAIGGFAFVNPSVNGLISRLTPADRQGEVLGVNQSASAMGRILGPAIGLTLFELTDNHVLPYAVASATLLCVLWMTRKLSRG